MVLVLAGLGLGLLPGPAGVAAPNLLFLCFCRRCCFVNGPLFEPSCSLAMLAACCFAGGGSRHAERLGYAGGHHLTPPMRRPP
ncbi:MAG: hypothetical protein WKG07_15420 [Hymenobacter sp.]